MVKSSQKNTLNLFGFCVTQRSVQNYNQNEVLVYHCGC